MTKHTLINHTCSTTSNIITTECPLGCNRQGSHNLIVGTDNAYASYGGAVLAAESASQAPYASVTGGWRNVSIVFIVLYFVGIVCL